MNRRISTILLGLTLAAGCKGPDVQAATADLWLFAPDMTTNIAVQMSANFGSACVAVGGDVTYTFQASAPAVITVNPVDILLTGPFSFVNKPTTPFNVSELPGGTITVHFDPTAPGPATGTLTIQAAQGANNMPLKITLTGVGANGAPEPLFDTSCPLPGAGSGTLPLTPCSNLTFQNVYFNSSQNIAVNLYNDGGCPPFVVDDVSVVYPNGLFSDGGGPFNPVGLTLPQSVALADPAYSLVMSYTPKCPTTGCTSTTDSAQLKIHTTNGFDGDAGTWNIDLNGSGVAPVVTLAGPGGETGCNKFARPGDIYAYERETVPLIFTITNGAQATPVVVGAAHLGSGSTGFTIDTNQCWTVGSGGLLPDGGISLPSKNSSATCVVSFDVVNAANKYPKNGAFFDYLVAPYTALVADGGQNFVATVCLRAVSQPVVCVDGGTSFTLPPVTYCGAVSQPIEISNCGSVDLDVNDIFLDTQTISSWTLNKGSNPPLTLQWSDPPITATVTYSDDGGVHDPSTAVIISSNATAGTLDGGTTVLIDAQANGLNPPPDVLVPVFTNGGGRDMLSGLTYQVDMPITGGPTPYTMNWYYMFNGATVDAGELVTDGGFHAWLTPTTFGVYSVCANVVEEPLPDGGNCNASLDGGGSCTNPKLTTF